MVQVDNHIWKLIKWVVSFRGFIEVCPTGVLTKEDIMQMYMMPKSQAKVFIDEMFTLFDADGNGTVCFKVIIVNTTVLCF